MGFWSGLCSCVSSVVRGACSAIGSIGRGALSLVKGCAIGIGKVVGGIWGGVGKMLSILKPQENPEELGEMAVQGAERGIKPELYKSNQDYIQALRDKIKIDREKFQKLNEQELHERRMLGTKIIVRGVEENLHIDNIPNKFLVTSGIIGLSAAQTLKMLETAKEKNVSLSDITDYLKERCSKDKIEATGKVIKEAVAVDSPSMSKDDVNRYILEAQDKLRNEKIDIPEEETEK